MAVVYGQRLIVGVWAVVLICIPLLSLTGRGMQNAILEHTDRTAIAIVFGLLTLALATAVGTWLVRRRGWVALLHLLWAGAVAVVILTSVNPGERWLHLPLFGLFGFLSVRAFGIGPGLAVALAVSVGDEVWQHFLPDRVGDPVDVMINAASATTGAVLARLGGPHRTDRTGEMAGDA